MRCVVHHLVEDRGERMWTVPSASGTGSVITSPPASRARRDRSDPIEDVVLGELVGCRSITEVRRPSSPTSRSPPLVAATARSAPAGSAGPPPAAVPAPASRVIERRGGSAPSSAQLNGHQPRLTGGLALEPRISISHHHRAQVARTPRTTPVPILARAPRQPGQPRVANASSSSTMPSNWSQATPMT